MDQRSQRLKILIKNLAIISKNSHDIYWIGTPDFKTCVFLNDAYEVILRYPREHLLKDFTVFSNYLHKKSHECHNPFLEMAQRTKLEGPDAVFEETYRIIRGDDHRIRIISDHGHPIFDSNGEHLGFAGVARDISNEMIRKQFPSQLLGLFPEDGPRRYYLKRKYKNVCFSRRQAECAFYLLQGKTAKQTAKILQLSHRTVEAVIAHIKNKLGLNYRADILDALIEGEFIDSLIF